MPDALQAVEESIERLFIARIQRLARCESAEVAQSPSKLRFATADDNDPRSYRAQEACRRKANSGSASNDNDR
jgi:hypothetical protein